MILEIYCFSVKTCEPQYYACKNDFDVPVFLYSFWKTNYNISKRFWTIGDNDSDNPQGSECILDSIIAIPPTDLALPLKLFPSTSLK